LLVGFVMLVVLLIATSKAVTVHHVDENDSGRPQSTNSAEITRTAPEMPRLPIEPTRIESTTQSIAKAAPLLRIPNAVPNASAVARREKALDLLRKALDLLRKARESQSDNVVYRQTLAELVRSYGDTPAGAEALNLLAAPEPASATTPDTQEEKPEVKPSDEKSAPRAQYGLGFMN